MCFNCVVYILNGLVTNCVPTREEKARYTHVRASAVKSVNETEEFDKRDLTDVLATLFSRQINELRAKCVGKFLGVPLTKLRNGRFYHFSNPAPAFLLNFEQARQWCEVRGMHLLTINNAYENTLVFDEAARRGMAGAVGNPGAWMGLNDIAMEGVYRWVQDNSLLDYPVYWKTDHPMTGNTLNCASLSGSAVTVLTSWVTLSCANTRAYICEMEEPCSYFADDFAVLPPV